MQTLLETLETHNDGEITETHGEFENLQRLAYECLRVLNIDEKDMYENIFKGAVHEETLIQIVEDNHELHEQLNIVIELKILYEQLSLLKLTGKTYELLDKFFNIQIGRTL